MEEANIEQTAQEAKQIEQLRKQRNADMARERTRRLRSLGLNARGKPLKDRHQNRDPEKQRRYQANYGKKHKAARERLGLTIAQFQKLPRATRLMELNYPATGKTTNYEKRKAQQREWYHQNKEKVMANRRSKHASNGILPADDRSVKFCPHCGWNIDATRKAQAFIDGRAG